MESLGTFLMKCRVANGLTRKDAASNILISEPALYKIEYDRSKPSLKTIKKLAKLYGFNQKEILEKYYVNEIK